MDPVAAESYDSFMAKMFPVDLDNLPEAPGRADYEKFPVKGNGMRLLREWGWYEGCGRGPGSPKTSKYADAIADMDGLVDGSNAGRIQILYPGTMFARPAIGGGLSKEERALRSNLQAGASGEKKEEGSQKVEAKAESRKGGDLGDDHNLTKKRKVSQAV